MGPVFKPNGAAEQVARAGRAGRRKLGEIVWYSCESARWRPDGRKHAAKRPICSPLRRVGGCVPDTWLRMPVVLQSIAWRRRFRGRRSRLLEGRHPGQRRRPGNQHRHASRSRRPVRDVQNDFLFLGSGWIHKDDALSVDEALEYFSTQIKENPEEAAYLNNRGRVWVAKNELRQGDRRLHAGGEARPEGRRRHTTTWAPPTKRRATTLKRSSTSTTALKINPEHATVYYNRGRANQYSDNYEAAAKDYADAMRVDPNYLPALQQRRLARGHLPGREVPRRQAGARTWPRRPCR